MRKAQDIVDTWAHPLSEINSFIDAWLKEYKEAVPDKAGLVVEAMAYSLNTGGKRFRPLLSLLTAEAIGKSAKDIIPFAVAVEFIHTYSLIHDDLPAMDDDDLRRGKPTSHKKFGEAVAILAGDTLLTESFHLITRSNATEANKLKAIATLTNASGGMGMVGGQIIDIETPSKEDRTLENILELHRLKTGALIKAAVKGAAELLSASDTELQNLQSYAMNLGVAFQIADDIEDARDGESGNFNYVHFLGEEGSFEKLNELSENAIESVSGFKNPQGLKDLVEFNRLRLNM